MAEEKQDLNNDQVVDELYDKINAPTSSDIPMTEPKAKSLDPDMFEFTANGKKIKATKDQVLQWASQGHDYSQKMEAFKKERGEYDPIIQKYKEIDEYAQANPDWFQHVQDSWNSRDKVTQQELQDNPELAAIKTELGDLKQFKEEFVAAKNREQREEEDKLLDMEIKSIKEQHSDYDWINPDEEGHTLEKKIMKHGIDHGIPSFKVAFRDYMHEKLIAKAEERGKETVGKDLAKKTKLGLLGETSTPTKGLQDAVNYKNKSYEDLLAEGLAELGS